MFSVLFALSMWSTSIDLWRAPQVPTGGALALAASRAIDDEGPKAARASTGSCCDCCPDCDRCCPDCCANGSGRRAARSSSKVQSARDKGAATSASSCCPASCCGSGECCGGCCPAGCCK